MVFGFWVGVFAVLTWRRIECVFTWRFARLRHTAVCLYGLIWLRYGYVSLLIGFRFWWGDAFNASLLGGSGLDRRLCGFVAWASVLTWTRHALSLHGSGFFYLMSWPLMRRSSISVLLALYLAWLMRSWLWTRLSWASRYWVMVALP